MIQRMVTIILTPEPPAKHEPEANPDISLDQDQDPIGVVPIVPESIEAE
jgi:hypothetical protein